MKFFTIEKLERLQTPDPDRLAAGLARWDATTERYDRHLNEIRSEVAASAFQLVDRWSFHDAQLLNLSYQDRDKLTVILRQGHQLHVLTFLLVGTPVLVRPAQEPRFASAGLLWLYEELDMAGRDTVLRVLLSDGSELVIPLAEVSVESFDVQASSTKKRSGGRVARSASSKRLLEPSAQSSSKSPSVLDRLSPVIPPLTRRAKDVRFPIVIRTRRSKSANGARSQSK